MIEADIPGYQVLRLTHLVLDYNGTLAVDGRLLPGVGERLERLAARLAVHVVTADTFGKAASGLSGLAGCELTILPSGQQTEAKRRFVEHLGREQVVAVGNGRNDAQMLKAAALGIAVIQGEGAAAETVLAADVVCPGPDVALDLLLHPLRLAATLRA